MAQSSDNVRHLEDYRGKSRPPRANYLPSPKQAPTGFLTPRFRVVTELTPHQRYQSCIAALFLTPAKQTKKTTRGEAIKLARFLREMAKDPVIYQDGIPPEWIKNIRGKLNVSRASPEEKNKFVEGLSHLFNVHKIANDIAHRHASIRLTQHNAFQSAENWRGNLTTVGDLAAKKAKKAKKPEPATPAVTL